MPFHTNHIDHVPRINGLKCISVKWQKLKTLGVIVNLYIEKFAIIQQKEKKKRPDGLIKWVGIQTQLIQILLQEIHVIFGVVDLFKKNLITFINFCLIQNFSFLVLKVSHLLHIHNKN